MPELGFFLCVFPSFCLLNTLSALSFFLFSLCALLFNDVCPLFLTYSPFFYYYYYYLLFLKSRWFREVTTLWPILLVIIFFKINIKDESTQEWDQSHSPWKTWVVLSSFTIFIFIFILRKHYVELGSEKLEGWLILYCFILLLLFFVEVPIKKAVWKQSSFLVIVFYYLFIIFFIFSNSVVLI